MSAFTQLPAQPAVANQSRRKALKSASLTVMALGLSSGVIRPASAQAGWNTNAFSAKGLNDTAKALGAAAAPVESKDIVIGAPDIAENGAVVRVRVTSKIPGTQEVAVLVEKNPNALAAQFALPEGTEAEVATNVKMGQSSDVFALVKANGKYYFAKKEVKVTLGGCGG